LLFPRKDGLRTADIDRWLDSLKAAGLIRSYQVDGEPFLTIVKFGQRLRQQRRQFPEPPDNFGENEMSAGRQQVVSDSHASSGLNRNEVEVETEGEVESVNTHTISKKSSLKKSINEGKRDHFFSESEFFEVEKFVAAFDGTDYEHCDLLYYRERMKNWAEGKGVKRKDWLAQVRNFMLGDAKENKLRLKNSSDGRETANNKQQPNEAWARDAFNKTMAGL